MPRILTDGPADDPRHTELADEDILKREIVDPDPERHAPVTHCQVCGRGLNARLTCVACGDEDDEQVAA